MTLSDFILHFSNRLLSQIINVMNYIISFNLTCCASAVQWNNLALFLQQFTHCDPRRTHTSSQEQLDTYFPTSEKGHDKQVNLTLNLSTCVPTSTSSKKAWTFEFYLLWWYYSEFSKTENILKKAWLGSILWVDDDKEEQSWEHMPFYYKKKWKKCSVNLFNKICFGIALFFEG